MKSELAKLVELQKTDTNIRRLKKSIDSAEERRAGIEQEFERHAFEIREIQNGSEAARAARAKIETQMAETRASLERAERNLKSSTNQKEYEASMREADALQKQISTLETQALEKMTAAEESEKVLAERADEIASLEGNRQTAVAEFEKELAEQRAAFEAETKKRQEVFVTLPTNLANVYNRMATRSRDGIAVAEVKNGACAACFMKLRPHMLMEIKRNDNINTCENCSRILYVDDAEEQTEAAVK